MRLCLDESVVGPWVCERTKGVWHPGLGRAIGKLDENGNIIAGVTYEDFNGVNIMAGIAGEGNWASRGFLGVIFDYPFNQLGAKRITVSVRANNLKSINLATRMGFELECVLSQATPDGDLYLFRLWRDNCRYLGGKYERRQGK